MMHDQGCTVAQYDGTFSRTSQRGPPTQVWDINLVQSYYCRYNKDAGHRGRLNPNTFYALLFGGDFLGLVY